METGQKGDIKVNNANRLLYECEAHLMKLGFIKSPTKNIHPSVIVFDSPRIQNDFSIEISLTDECLLSAQTNEFKKGKITGSKPTIFCWIIGELNDLKVLFEKLYDFRYFISQQST